MTATAGRLTGRRAVVTGAARGIGRAIAGRFHAEGAAVVLLDVLADDVRRAAAELGERAHAGTVDLRDAGSVQDAFGAAIERLGGLDILVNNAGIFAKTPLLELPVSEWDEMFAVNTRSMLLTTQAAAPAMIAAGGGRIVNMASMGAKLGTPGESAYCASKAAVVAFTRIAAKELGPHGITVNCICPGYVLTEMGASTRTAEQVAEWSSASPLGRLASPEDVASMALFLASADGAYCTGQAMNVSGGMVMH